MQHVQLDDTKNRGRFMEYMDKQLEALQPPGAPPDSRRRIEVWMPKRTIKAWSEKYANYPVTQRTRCLGFSRPCMALSGCRRRHRFIKFSISKKEGIGAF